MGRKARIDELTVLQGLADDIDQARRLIMAGKVRSGDRVWDKAGEKVPVETPLELKGQICRWVSRGGLKLEKALTDFHISPQGMHCIDIGASTGGFTDVLLTNGATSVVALDVGYGLLDARLQNDPRVRVLDRTNFRTVAESELGGPFDLVVTDVSFISLLLILPKAAGLLKTGGSIIALIKPQFEAGRGEVPEGGVITDPEMQIHIIRKLKRELAGQGLGLFDLAPVPLLSHKKNIEFLSLWRPAAEDQTSLDIDAVVLAAHSDAGRNREQ